jgi:hypothetical protein
MKRKAPRQASCSGSFIGVASGVLHTFRLLKKISIKRAYETAHPEPRNGSPVADCFIELAMGDDAPCPDGAARANMLA